MSACHGLMMRYLILFLCLLPLGASPVLGASATLVSQLDSKDSAIVLKTDGDVEKYRYYELENPSRLVVDVYNVRPEFPDRSFLLAGVVTRVRVGLYEDKTRFVFDVSKGTAPDFSVKKVPGGVSVSWDAPAGQAPTAVTAESGSPASVKESKTSPTQKVTPKATPKADASVEDIAFEIRDDSSYLTVRVAGTPKLIPVVADGAMIRFGFQDTAISRALSRIIDTSSFPSIVRRVTPYSSDTSRGPSALFAVELRAPSEYEVTRTADTLVLRVPNGDFAVEAPESEEVVVPVLSSGTAVEVTEPSAVVSPDKNKKPAQKSAPVAVVTDPVATTAVAVVDDELVETYDPSERVSLRFEKADIHMVLQLIADISGKNIIATDEVRGNVTLKLDDVPWRQALGVILEVSELGMLESGNVIRVRPVAKIREVEQARLSANATKEKLEPLVTEYFEVNYSDLGSITGPLRELLSERGRVSQDDRNKQLIVTDVPSRIEDVRKLIRTLDLPVRQVMIEARIIEVDSTFSRDLGVKWGITYNNDGGSGLSSVSDASAGLGGSFLIAPATVSSGVSAGVGVDMTFGRLGIDSTVLDLRLSAIETSGYGKVVSRPRVTTVTGVEAIIEQGTKIPYQTIDESGNVSTAFEEANLELKVVPVINPDRSVILEIQVSNDSVGSNVATGAGTAPAINQKKAQTNVLVNDGETTVIGGVFVESENDGVAGVPILKDIPLIGKLFQSRNISDRKSELLIFITPKILN